MRVMEGEWRGLPGISRANAVIETVSPLHR